MNMRTSTLLLALTLALLIATACTPQTGPLATQTPTLPAAATAPAGETALPTDTPTVVTATPAAPSPQPTTADTALPTAPAPTQSVTELPPDDLPYLDDRSGPGELIRSYFNAVNRREYLRAYAYWNDPSDAAPSFDAFAAGYEDTAGVVVNLGQIGGDPGAGQMYYSVPALLEVEQASGSEQTYAACYVLRLSNPAAQAEPPFRPLGIEQGKARLVEEDASAAAQLASICADLGLPTGPPIVPAPTGSPQNIGSGVYLDNRSDPAVVLASLFNAVNRKEYARAYSYWAPEAAIDYTRFRQGYADTESVELLTGQVTGDAGAGQLNYAVPVVLTARTTGGQIQTFAGCYFLHLSQPAVQAALPFRPLAVRSARLGFVQPGAIGQDLLPESCAP